MCLQQVFWKWFKSELLEKGEFLRGPWKTGSMLETEAGEPPENQGAGAEWWQQVAGFEDLKVEGS